MSERVSDRQGQSLRLELCSRTAPPINNQQSTIDNNQQSKMWRSGSGIRESIIQPLHLHSRRRRGKRTSGACARGALRARNLQFAAPAPAPRRPTCGRRIRPWRVGGRTAGLWRRPSGGATCTARAHAEGHGSRGPAWPTRLGSRGRLTRQARQARQGRRTKAGAPRQARQGRGTSPAARGADARPKTRRRRESEEEKNKREGTRGGGLLTRRGARRGS